jgi:hypothetical protein
MKFFLHTYSRVRIVYDDHEFECTPERFVALEPEYPGLLGGVARYWTPEKAFLEGLPAYDGHDCGQYCDKVSQYTQYPVIYADVSLSKNSICGSDLNDSIQFSASLQDSQGTIIPIDYLWNIRLTHEEAGDIDRIQLQFLQGMCSASYTFSQHLPFGSWFLDEQKFDLVDVVQTFYQVRLVRPVEFVVYRSL